MTPIQEITTPDLKTATTQSPSALSVQLIGNAESASMRDLDEFLKRIHGAALESKLPEVVVDLRELEFMNSSCFKTFVSWVNAIQEAAADRQYKVRFVGDQNKHWQNRSLGALACFAIDLIRVEW